MELSYNNLWKTLIDKKMKKGTLCQEAEISTRVCLKIKKCTKRLFISPLSW